MDKKLGNCLASLRDAAELARGGEYTDLAPYVADLSDICGNLVSDDDISFAIANVFDEEIGVFSVVESLMPVRDRHVAKGRELCLNFLSTFVKKIGGRAHPYAAILKVIQSVPLCGQLVSPCGCLDRYQFFFSFSTK